MLQRPGAGYPPEPAPNDERESMPSKRPTPKQLAYLRTLAERTGQTFVSPQTRRDASAEIRRLKAAPAESQLVWRIERDEIADAIGTGAQDSARVIRNEVNGYGSNCRWSQ
jgi:hypothetical protein